MQLKNEAKFLSKYNSELIPKLYDVEEDRDNLYLVEEYIQGTRLDSSDFNENILKDDELVNIVVELFEFLKFLNSLEESLLYIDWKPANIMLTKNGLKVVDFGSVISIGNEDNYMGLATEGFAAPELINGNKLGSYTDIYGFGSILMYLTKQTEGRKTLLRRTVKERCERLALQCTRENYKERPGLRTIEKTVRNFNKRIKTSL